MTPLDLVAFAIASAIAVTLIAARSQCTHEWTPWAEEVHADRQRESGKRPWWRSVTYLRRCTSCGEPETKEARA